jgi:hypothetical protein
VTEAALNALQWVRQIVEPHLACLLKEASIRSQRVQQRTDHKHLLIGGDERLFDCRHENDNGGSEESGVVAIVATGCWQHSEMQQYSRGSEGKVEGHLHP